MPYETITVGEGEHRTIEVGTGETFENVLIDITRDGASATIDATTTGWTIRNVGFTGSHDNPKGPALRLADRGGQQSVVDYVYLADGDRGGRTTGVEVSHAHNGELLVSRTRVEDFGERGFHSARPALGGAGGTTRYAQCYGSGNWGANFQTGEDELDRCVADSRGKYDGRALWAWELTHAYRCHLRTGSAHYAVHAGIPGQGIRVTLEETEYDTAHDGGLHTETNSTIDEIDTGTTPDPERPDTPNSPEDAANGSDSPIVINPPSEDNYETIEAPFSYRLSDGETWENKMIDFGDRNNVTITAKGSDWTIRNIGFKGTIPYNETIFGVCDSGGGTSTMENIYFGEATGNQPASERSICIWTDPDHSGTMHVRNVNFNVPGNNGIYGSAPAYNGNGGEIHLENCYGNDCHHTAFRIGDNGMSIDNCVAYKSGTRAANRGIWVWEGNYSGAATITNTHITTNGTGGGVVDNGNPRINMDRVYTDDGSGTHGSPEHFIPEGCPENAAQAASGSGPSAGDPSSPPDDGSSGDDGTVGDQPSPSPDYPDDPGRPETVTVEVSPGDHYTYRVGDGETFENVIIDCTNRATAATLICEGSDWTVQNVAFAGSQDLVEDGPCYAITAAVDSGSTGMIDNVWLGDGSHAGWGECGTYGRGGIYATENHAGTLRIERSTIAWWPGTAIHGHDANVGGGTIDVGRCLLEQNGYTYASLGTDGSSMEECVINHDLSNPGGGS